MTAALTAPAGLLADTTAEYTSVRVCRLCHFRIMGWTREMVKADFYTHLRLVHPITILPRERQRRA